MRTLNQEIHRVSMNLLGILQEKMLRAPYAGRNCHGEKIKRKKKVEAV